MEHRPSFRQRSLTKLSRRARYLLSRVAGARLQKSQRVYRVEINGQQFKRVILRDSYLAAQIEQALEAYGPAAHLPSLVTRYEHEIWVDFVAGEIPQVVDDALVQKVAEFYAAIYSRCPQIEATESCIWLDRLDRDIAFLNRVGVLSTAEQRQLSAKIADILPTTIWQGFDYNDPVLKNFVLTHSGKLCGIDIEAVVQDQLIGLGIAKALLRWMEPYRNIFFDAYQSHQAPDFLLYIEFVELVHLAAYTKLMFVEQKWTNVKRERFGRFI